MKPAVIARGLMQAMSGVFVRMRVLCVMLLAVLLLSGCVKYDLGINFESPNQGEIVQHIKLGDQVKTLSNGQAQEWLNSLERRARELQGKAKRVSQEEVIVRIPFSSGTELQEKFNEFFNPPKKKGSQAVTDAENDLPQIQSNFNLAQGNFIFWIRNKLTYDVDLRALGVISSNGNVIVSPGTLIDLEFSLNTPGGAKSVANSADALQPAVLDKGHQLVWTLQPGQLNHLEAVFWLPNPLGVGTLVIVGLVVLGFYLKYKQLPGSGTGITSAPTVPNVNL